MTMVPAQNLSKQHHHHQTQTQKTHGNHLFDYASCDGSTYTEPFRVMSQVEAEPYDSCVGGSSDLLIGPIVMADQDESRTTSSLNEAATSSSKDHAHHNRDDHKDDDDEGWLQLSIGARHSATTTRGENHDRTGPLTIQRSGGLIELDLLSGGSTQQVTGPLQAASRAFPKPEFVSSPSIPAAKFASATGFSSSPSYNYFQYAVGGSSSTNFAHRQEINWSLRPPYLQSLGAVSSSSPFTPSSNSALSLMPLGSNYFPRPFQLQMAVDVAGPSSEFRIIDPPRRPHSSIWFMLQASQNQAREPFLPQVPKSYLRIKDGRMTVRLIMKYLVNKLRLDSESEVEITCRGQQLLPMLTLQHVRDNIWSCSTSSSSSSASPPTPQAMAMVTPVRDVAVTLLPESSATDHLMVLHYGRSSNG